MASVLRALGNKVIVQRVEADKESRGGILLPNQGDKPEEGIVVAAGPGEVLPDGTLRETAVCIGERVIFGKSVGDEVEFEGDKLLVMSDKQIVAVIED